LREGWRRHGDHNRGYKQAFHFCSLGLLLNTTRWTHVVFRAACNMGLKGIVAKRRDSRYGSSRSRDWIKIKNMAHPAIERAMLIALSKRVAGHQK
jgi:hypothetical protein